MHKSDIKNCLDQNIVQTGFWLMKDKKKKKMWYFLLEENTNVTLQNIRTSCDEILHFLIVERSSINSEYQNPKN